jgi:hypothetical protein
MKAAEQKMQRIAKRLKTISDSCIMLYNPTLERKKTRKIHLFLDEESVEVGGFLIATLDEQRAGMCWVRRPGANPLST